MVRCSGRPSLVGVGGRRVVRIVRIVRVVDRAAGVIRGITGALLTPPIGLREPNHLSRGGGRESHYNPRTSFVAVHESGFGTERTYRRNLAMSACGAQSGHASAIAFDDDLRTTLPGSLTCKNVTVIDFQRSMLLRREPAGPPRRWVDGGFRHGLGRTETAGPRRMQVRRGPPGRARDFSELCLSRLVRRGRTGRRDSGHTQDWHRWRPAVLPSPRLFSRSHCAAGRPQAGASTRGAPGWRRPDAVPGPSQRKGARPGPP